MIGRAIEKHLKALEHPDDLLVLQYPKFNKDGRPQIADLDDKRSPSNLRDEPCGEQGEEGGRRYDHNVRSPGGHQAEKHAGDHERDMPEGLFGDALIGCGVQPCAHDFVALMAFDAFAKASVLRRHDAGRMIWNAGENGDVGTFLIPVAGKLAHSSLRGTYLRGKVVADEKYPHWTNFLFRPEDRGQFSVETQLHRVQPTELMNGDRFLRLGRRHVVLQRAARQAG